MAEVPKTVGGSSPDYATWTLLFAAVPADITTATGTDEHWIGKQRDVSLNEAFNVIGITTDSTNRVTMTYDTGAQHDGRSRAVSGSGAEIANTHTSGVVRPQINHFTIDGLVVRNSNATSNAAIACEFGTYASGANDVVIKNCIAHNTGTSSPDIVLGGGTTNLDLTIFNTIAYGYSRIFDSRGANTFTVSYCTFWRHADQIGVLSTAELTCKNTYSGKASGSNEDFWTGGAAPSGSNNCSSDTSATTDYTSSLVSKAGSDQFNNVTAGSEDFGLKSGSDVEAQGTNVSGITTDIIGTSRHATAPDIGAREFVPAGADVDIVLTDFISASDIVARFALVYRKWEESIDTTDTVSIEIITAIAERVLSDSLSVSDALSRFVEVFRAIQDVSVVTDSILQEALYYRKTSSSVAVISDDVSSIVALILTKVLSDSVVVQDSILSYRDLSRIFIESVAVVDEALRSTELLRLLDDNTEVSDSIIAAIITSFVERVLSDRLDVSDTLVQTLLRSEHVQFIIMSLVKRDIDFDIKLRNIVMRLVEKDIDNELN